MSEDSKRNKVEEKKQDCTDKNEECGCGCNEEKKQESNLIKYLDIVVKQQDLDKEIIQIAGQYASEMNMRGFRKGNIPVDIVLKRFKKELDNEAQSKILEDAVFKEVKAQKLKIADTPVIEESNYKEGEGLTAKVKVELMPEITLPELEKMEVDFSLKDMDDKSFEETKKESIDRMLQSNSYEVPVDREVKDMDMVEIKIQSTILAKNKKTPFKNIFIKISDDYKGEILDITKELIGKKPGDSFVIERDYPDNYEPKAFWSNKKLSHSIEIMGIKEKKVPEYDEKFVKSIGFESIEELEERLKKEFEVAKENKIENLKFLAFYDKLISELEFELPESLILKESYQAAGQMQQFLMQAPEENKKEFLEEVRPQAEKNLRVKLIKMKITEDAKIKVEKSDLEKEYKNIAEQSNLSVAQVKQYYGKNQSAIEDMIYGKKLDEYIKSKVIFKETK